MSMAKRVCQSNGKGKNKKVSSKASSSDWSSSKWASLPDDLLNSIVEKVLPDLFDYIRFSVVCKSWNSMALKHKDERIRLNNHQLPFLFVRAMNENGQPKFSLYNSITLTEITNLKLRIPSKFKHTTYCGSSRGWLFFFMKKKAVLSIINPISGKVIGFPPLDKELFRDVGSAILSSDPSLGSFEVLVTDEYSEEVAHLKFGDEVWAYLERRDEDYIYKLTFYKDGIIGTSCGGGRERGQIVSLRVIHTSTHSPSHIIVEELAPKVEFMYSSEYAVAETTNGDLLMICKSYKNLLPRWEVYKIIDSNGKFDINRRVFDLSGHSLFLQKGSCISVLASNYPGCRSNSIYQFEKNYQGPLRIEIFNLKDRINFHTDRRKFEISGFEGSWNVPGMKLWKAKYGEIKYL